MTDAVAGAGLAPADEEELLGYLTMAAHSLINERV
jgi:truncated hemoglobin YjbI